MKKVYYVVNKNNKCWTYKDSYDLYKNVLKHADRSYLFTDVFSPDYDWYLKLKIHGDFVVFDHLWKVVDCSRIYNKYSRKHYKVFKWFYKDHCFKFRVDPVPFTGNRYRGCFYKDIKTTQERRLSCEGDHKKYCRPKRNRRNLPNSWDDLGRSDFKNRSWKRTKKKKQWM